MRGGDINNVYGGNDISGKVYGGNAVGIRTSVRGDVYGGGNGSYPYTDNIALKNDDIYSLGLNLSNEFDPRWSTTAIKDSYKALMYKHKIDEDL